MASTRQADYMQHAKEAIAYVKSLLVHGSNTEKSSQQANWDPEKIVIVREKIDEALGKTNHWINDNFHLTLFKITKQVVKEHGFGNCDENARLAFLYLKKKGVFPIDYCHMYKGDHVLIVIGRKANSDPSDMSTWGDEAVICDPWAEVAYPITQFNEMKKPKHDVKLPAICYEDGKTFPHYLTGELVSDYREDEFGPVEEAVSSACLIL